MTWEDIRRNWKLIAAMTLAFLAALATALTVAFFPPAIVAIAGFSIFGTMPFTGLLGFSLVGQCFAAAGIVATATLCASLLFNAIVKVYNSLDAEIKPGPRPGTYEDLFEPLNDNGFDSSHYNMQEGLGRKKQPVVVPVVVEHADPKEPYQPPSPSIFVAPDLGLSAHAPFVAVDDNHPLSPTPDFRS